MVGPRSEGGPWRVPDPSDHRWRSASRVSNGRPTRYLPFSRPVVPPLPGRLDWLRSATRLVLLADGYPARLKSGRLAIHPLDGRYLLEALLAEQEAHPRRRLHQAIRRTAHAIVRRAEPLGDALVMRYRDTASSLVEGAPHISALPQAYYAAGLTRAAQLLGEPDLGDAADRFFAALRLPVEQGGALYRSGNEAVLALVPTRPRDLVLNGWLSALVAVHAYAELRPSGLARELFAANLPSLRRLLPAYDMPGLRLSRYALTGPLLMRLRWTPAAQGVVIDDLRVSIPSEEPIRLLLRPGGRWASRSLPEDAVAEASSGGIERLLPRRPLLRFSAVLSRAPFPEPNRIRLRITSPIPLNLTLDAHIGRYDPMASATVDRNWVTLAARRVRDGTQELDLALPYEPIDLFAYPTNFTRGGPGAKVNTYHGTHIVRLRELSDITGESFYREWADRWHQYVREWDSVPGLDGAECRTPEGKLE